MSRQCLGSVLCHFWLDKINHIQSIKTCSTYPPQVLFLNKWRQNPHGNQQIQIYLENECLSKDCRHAHVSVRSMNTTHAQQMHLTNTCIKTRFLKTETTR